MNARQVYQALRPLIDELFQRIAGLAGAIQHLASAWGQDSGFDFGTEGAVLATATITPTATGKIRVLANTNLFNDSGETIIFVVGVTHGSGVLTPLVIELLMETFTDNADYPNLTVDLWRLSPPILAPVGQPFVVNVIGKTASETMSNILSTIALQEEAA
jgi:hypothetical protein